MVKIGNKLTVRDMILTTLAAGPMEWKVLIQSVVSRWDANWQSVKRELSALVTQKRVAREERDSRVWYKLAKDKVEEEPGGLSDAEIKKYLTLAEQQQPFLRKLAGIARSPVIKLPEAGWFGIVFGSDWHIGSVWTQLHTLLAEAMTIKATPHLYYMFGGDSVDGGVPAGPHGGILNEQIMPPEMQRAVASWIARLLGRKMILAVSGCHEWWTMDAADYDFIKEAAKRSGCPYMGGGGKYYIECEGGARWCGVYHHRAQGHSQYNDLHPCVRRALFHEQEADVICVAHEHVSATGMAVIGEKMRYMARPGARKNFDRYASKLAADEKRARVHLDVPVLLLHGTDNIGMWIRGVELGAKTLTAMRQAGTD